MSTIEKFKIGTNNSFRFISQQEALREACELLSVFTDKHSAGYERDLAMYGGGQYAGAIHEPELSEVLYALFEKCASIPDGEAVDFSPKEKQFIKAGIRGDFFSPFYE